MLTVLTWTAHIAVLVGKASKGMAKKVAMDVSTSMNVIYILTAVPLMPTVLMNMVSLAVNAVLDIPAMEWTVPTLMNASKVNTTATTTATAATVTEVIPAHVKLGIIRRSSQLSKHQWLIAPTSTNVSPEFTIAVHSTSVKM